MSGRLDGTKIHLELGGLKCYLDRKPPLPEHEAREITYQILDGLFLMHDNDYGA